MRLLTAVVVVLLGAAGPARAQTTPDSTAAVTAAESAARAWLQQIDGGRYGESWDSAAAIFRGAVTRSGWEGAVKEGRAPFEPFGARELLRASFQRQLPNAPPGAYVVIQFRAKGGKGQTVIETITPARDTDGRWRVAGYYVRPE
jgi:hypothetical protein